MHCIGSGQAYVIVKGGYCENLFVVISEDSLADSFSSSAKVTACVELW